MLSIPTTQEEMKISNMGICLLLFLFGIAAPKSSSLEIQWPNVRSSENSFGFFVFGNSYLDVGNNNYINGTMESRANFPPYGESFFPIPTGRFSDGRIVADFLAEYAGMSYILPYLDPKNNNYMNGVNFASGGAGVLVETHSDKQALRLRTQMNFFKKVEKSLRKKMGNERSQSFFSNSVFLFSFGGNDYLHRIINHPDTIKTIEAQEHLVNMVIGNITIALKEIYNCGGRKFGFIGLSPTGYLPNSRLQRSEEFFELTSSTEKLHDKLLPIALQKLTKQLKGFKYAFVDTNTFLLQRIQHPTKYGFKVVDTACCGSEEFRGYYNCGRNIGPLPYTLCTNVEDYLFFDSYHPTQKAFEQLSKLIWSGGDEIVQPYNFKQLFQYDSTLASD